MRQFVLARFDSSERLLEAARKVREGGGADLDSYTPYPVHGLEEALGLKKSKVPLVALIGGVSGASGGYLMQWWTNAVDFPINVGNRLLNSAPAFIPITFELGILCSALSIFFSILIFARLPQPYHPVFEVEEFRSASTHAFWLSVRVESPEKRAEWSDQLVKLGASHVSTVEAES